MGAADDNEVLMRRWVALFNDHDAEGLDSIVAPDYVEHSPDSPSGPKGLKTFFATVYAGFSDARMALDEVVADEDKVGGRVTIEGTHDGVFLGRPPTGRRIAIRSLDIFRVADGRLAEHWEAVDRRAITRQLGEPDR